MVLLACSGAAVSFIRPVLQLANVRLAVHLQFSSAFRLRTWDRFVVPLPFSRLTIIFDELLDVPRQMDDDAFEAKRIEVESLMCAGVDDLHLPLHDHSERKRNSC